MKSYLGTNESMRSKYLYSSFYGQKRDIYAVNSHTYQRQRYWTMMSPKNEFTGIMSCCNPMLSHVTLLFVSIFGIYHPYPFDTRSGVLGMSIGEVSKLPIL